VTFSELKLLGLVQKFRNWDVRRMLITYSALSALIGYEDANTSELDYDLSTDEVFGRQVVSYAKTYGRLDGLN
jgi:hypothetical protein